MRYCTYVGIDTHSTKNVLWAINVETGEVRSTTIHDGDPASVLEWAEQAPGLAAPFHFVYESGPTGFTLARALRRAGHGCTVAAVTRLPYEKGRVKTDMRDAEFLARCLVAGHVHAVHVPTEREEAARHLSHLRGQAPEDLQRAKQRVASFMLLTGTPYTETKCKWTKTFFAWAERAELPCEADTFVFRSLVAEVVRLTDALAAVDERIRQALSEDGELAARAARLECVAGIGRVTAFPVVAEVGDFTRFRSGAALAHCLGLTPRVRATNEHTARGSITKRGNPHVRRLLIEAAGAYSRGSRPPRKECPGRVPPDVAAHAAKCSARLFRLRRRLVCERGLGANKAKVALARELAEWVWHLQVMDAGPGRAGAAGD